MSRDRRLFTTHLKIHSKPKSQTVLTIRFPTSQDCFAGRGQAITVLKVSDNLAIIDGGDTLESSIRTIWIIIHFSKAGLGVIQILADKPN